MTLGSDQSVTFAGTPTYSSGTINGVAYLNASKVLTTGSALVFDGTNFSTTGSGTLKNLLLSGGTLPAAGNPSISLRSSDNTIYHQSGSANTIVFLDSAQNTMYNMGATSHAWNISNAVKMTLDSAGNLGLGVTPNAWYAGSSAHVYQVNRAAIYSDTSGSAFLSNNYLFNTSGAEQFINNGYANRLLIDSGAYKWFVSTTSNSSGGIASATMTQAMTLDAGGSLLVGKTAGAAAVVGAELRPGGVILSTLSASTNADLTYQVYSTGAGAYRFYVGLGGTVYATSIVITAISDERLKENVRDLDTGLSSIMALKPRRFDWKEGKGQDKKDVAGFIAQEFETVFPECVSTSKAGEDGIEYKNINHETLIPTLVKAIQELKAEFDTAKEQIAALQGAA
jgi:hypothetical protein